MTQLITQQNPLITFKITLTSPQISSTHQFIPKTHLKNPKISAKWGKKRSGSQKSRKNKLIFDAITAVVSNLKILPEPFDSLVREFFWVSSGGGNGGKFRYKLGFGGDGGGNWGRNNKAKKLGFWVILGISIGLSMWVVLEKERGIDLCGVWVLCVSAFVVGDCFWRREVRNWGLGFFCGVVLMGLGFRNDGNFGKLVDSFKHKSRNFGIFSKKKGFRRWV
ncbi:hypothetical protein RND81_09G225700 [Saponaria officinalis]|uniref:Transmembrane protein n=1 Tax=Saponaria officinalis TaxID=3572 RepID=A0AAW1IP77_SAPOF